MTNAPNTGGIHHLSLTISDMKRSVEFYTSHIGFDFIVQFAPTRTLVSNGAVLLSLGEPYYPDKAIEGDAFDENRIGMDHISFSVDNLAALEEAAAYFDEQGIAHGEIKDLGEAFAIYVMAFRDPDNTQLELTAPYAE